ncbi:hypothetical protein [Marinobacter sp. BSs20148]|jgi:hypothetical protein|uniref:hypothetical protein n=1 Tax=Marinobacter sp. BSs20148 TaxID=490759 RepID=UPI0002776F31|nr:hypothetical protein [Marinobacter sp. BSs20148]AFP30696.1 hypothetical protein MRBBS_1759 [Marinobacter sp. BSs20148]
MVTATHRKNLIPLLALLLALAGMTLSVVGGVSSHGVAELSAFVSEGHDGQSHNHDDVDEKSNSHPHHDAGNHSHESADRLTTRLLTGYSISLRLPIPYAGDSPRTFRFRLERPPKTSLIV